MLAGRRLGRRRDRLRLAAPAWRDGWYWAALARPGEPLLHVTEWDVPGRADPLLVKAHGLWAEHICDAPMEQWTIANETYATALDDPDDALGRAYGMPSAVAFDLEWYATAPPVGGVGDGYQQHGVVHGVIELPAGRCDLTEVPARRWHRWATALAPRAAGGLRPRRRCGRRSPSRTAPSPTGCSPRTAGGLGLRRRRRDGRRRGWRPGPMAPVERRTARATSGEHERGDDERGDGGQHQHDGEQAADEGAPAGGQRVDQATVVVLDDVEAGVAEMSRVRVDIATRSSRPTAWPAASPAPSPAGSARPRAAHAVDVDGLVVEGPDPLDAGSHVGDRRVEIGQLVGDVLGELVERRDRADSSRASATAVSSPGGTASTSVARDAGAVLPSSSVGGA